MRGPVREQKMFWERTELAVFRAGTEPDPGPILFVMLIMYSDVLIDKSKWETLVSIAWYISVRSCIVVSEDYLGEYMCNVTDDTGLTLSKYVYLWCKY